jgi:hypothetical protein
MRGNAFLLYWLRNCIFLLKQNTHSQMIKACQSSDDFETKCAHLILFIFHQPVHQVGADKSSSSSYQNPHIRLPTKGKRK